MSVYMYEKAGAGVIAQEDSGKSSVQDEQDTSMISMHGDNKGKKKKPRREDLSNSAHNNGSCSGSKQTVTKARTIDNKQFHQPPTQQRVLPNTGRGEPVLDLCMSCQQALVLYRRTAITITITTTTITKQQQQQQQQKATATKKNIL
ncbi:LOW QUALITY PROTEIN: hypothetical protein PoB_004800500 [Plakobranchus ocellatus]|uniref:Uncharacterized protein n=1 Tax=Plakobranchus ocellatus TaxID=259542 RepID=A0AAV4BPW1_9GAST|nr:LOW QUALITY PROTEIN: hypothetical protein PoB_004800500 [Plakobranchus ocellatus]